MKHIPRKRFGQHFLSDASLIAALVQEIAPSKDDCMVEIGPGMGALTRPLLAQLSALTVIELDRDLAAFWRSQGLNNLKVIESDVLKVDFIAAEYAQAATNSVAIKPPLQSLRIVGNLPYNISTPILFHLMGVAHKVQDQHFMLQKEVIDRMCAKPATADYGRLSVMLQWRYEMESILHVPPESFEPPPRVQSAVVRMRPHKDFLPLDVKMLENLVKVAFSQRRKLLRHSLEPWLGQQKFGGEFDFQRRAEEVPVHEYLDLAQQLPSRLLSTTVY